MQQKILQNVDSQIERLHILQSNAEEIIERFQYDRTLETHEIQELEADFAKLSIELQRMQAEAKQVASEYAESIKLIKKRRPRHWKKYARAGSRLPKKCL